MRITIIGRDFPPAVGGIGDHTDLLAAELVRRGQTVTVVCSPPADQRAAFDVVPAIRRWDARGIPAVIDAVARTKPDVILWQYNPFTVGRRGLAPGIGRLARALAAEAPLVLLAHELWFPRGRGGWKGRVWATTHRMQMRALARSAARIIVTTDQRADELARALPATRARLHVVPIGANIQPGSSSTDMRARLGIPAAAFVVAHLGSVGPGRETGRVFASIQELRARGLDARLVLAGGTGPFTAPPSLRDAVIAPGVSSREQLSDTLACADVYVHPDLVGPAAGRRGSLVAALAHGLPVVAFRGPDHAPQLADGENVVLADPDDLTHALATLAADPARARRIGAQARDTYRRSFAWELVGVGVLDAVQEAAR